MGTTFAGIEVSSKRHIHLSFRDEFLLSSIIFIIITIDNFFIYFLIVVENVSFVGIFLLWQKSTVIGI